MTPTRRWSLLVFGCLLGACGPAEPTTAEGSGAESTDPSGATEPAPEVSEAEDVGSAELPRISPDEITALEIRRPSLGEGDEAESVRIERDDDGWSVVAPLRAPADSRVVQIALHKLEDLDAGEPVAAADRQGSLEVDDASAVRVTVEQRGAEPVVLLIGTYAGGATMVRLAGESQVFPVEGSIRYAFARELRDWRNRRVVDERVEEVVAVRFEGAAERPRGFVRGRDGGWTRAEGRSGELDGDAVGSIVASLSRLRAVDFAAPGIDADAAALSEPACRATLTLDATDEQAETQLVLSVGAQREGTTEVYAQRSGDPTIYVVSAYLAERICGRAASAPVPNVPDGPEGAGTDQIPPELMRQIHQQLREQQGDGDDS